MHAVVDTVKTDLRDFTTLSPQVRFLLIIQLVILFILSILVGVIFSPKFKDSIVKQDIGLTVPQKDSSVELSKTHLQIIPNNEFIRVDDESTFSVTMTGLAPYATDIVLTYDPMLIEVVNITNGDMFDREILNEIDNGRIVFSAAQSPGADAELKKEGTVMRFTIKALNKSQESYISFDKENTIAAYHGDNIVGNLGNAQIHIFD